jgi:hypothetical protein
VKAVDLIGRPVYDAGGEPLGTVNDLLFDADDTLRAPRDAGTPAYRLAALECGGVGLAHRLGYAHHRMAGPWPLPALFRLLSRRSVVVEWDDITRIDADAIHVGRHRADLPAATREDLP